MSTFCRASEVISYAVHLFISTSASLFTSVTVTLNCQKKILFYQKSIYFMWTYFFAFLTNTYKPTNKKINIPTAIMAASAACDEIKLYTPTTDSQLLCTHDVTSLQNTDKFIKERYQIYFT